MGSDMFRSVCDRIRYGTDLLCLHGTSSKLEWYDSIHPWLVGMSGNVVEQETITARTDGACLPNFEYQHGRFKDWAIAPSMPGERRLENLK